ncbi:hypothetical protein P875_00128060 [Aspergillus parasiticus SU-1]|uniref:MACPF domain-containing protein n=1 Tax=Aspergillus parasiticus (strain ATCC 56775 / NRRL 5862 / SRRC 143 / SU-1) TaxID=1403190 RepID=A0A0F0IFJ1_ASPPU|nr:hypothetical protein P875_00128060 [Aspergillus parasiticus SU-1]
MGEGDITLTLQKYDLKSRGATPTSRAIVPKTFREAALQHLRWYLVQNKRLPKEYVNQKFCDKDGADVPDDTTFDVYTKLNKESEEDSFNVYFIAPGEQESIWTGMDDGTAAFLKEGLDLKTSQQMAFLNPSLNKLTSSVKKDDWKASAGKADTHAADMNERQWGIVMRNNDLLNAFALKERSIPDYDVTFEAPKDIPGNTKKPEIKFRIPRFQICDSSRVEVFETKSAIADSMASNAFSQTTVEASAGGGAFGVSVGVKAGATTSGSSSFAQSSSKDESRMHVAYLFPRVEIFLDVDDLEVTEECKKYLDKIRDPKAKKEDADTFFQKFGHVFVPHVQLGGRLHSVESTSSIAGATTEEKASALKAAASASVSGWGFQASIIKWDDRPDAKPYLGMVSNEELLERPEAGGGNFSRRAMRHVLNKSHTREEHLDSSLEVLALKNQLVWEGSNGTTPRFKFGTLYPMRFSVWNRQTDERALYAVRRTTTTEHYQNENVLYAGMNEEPNVLVRFSKLEKENKPNGVSFQMDFDAATRADKIGAHDWVRMDYYDIQTKENVGWLQNNGGIAKLNELGDLRMDASVFKFMYL